MEVEIGEKKFRLMITADEIALRVNEIAQKINQQEWPEPPLLICILKGSFMFTADLVRKLQIPHSLEFLQLSSYANNLTSSGEVKGLDSFSVPVQNRPILILEDIVDTGLTIESLRNHLLHQGVVSVQVACLLFKPGSFKGSILPEFCGQSIPDNFVIGYGMDVAEQGRNLPDIYVLETTN
jgi:hypoxanthine phosphoribosyltransferase